MITTTTPEYVNLFCYIKAIYEAQRGENDLKLDEIKKRLIYMLP